MTFLGGVRWADLSSDTQSLPAVVPVPLCPDDVVTVSGTSSPRAVVRNSSANSNGKIGRCSTGRSSNGKTGGGRSGEAAAVILQQCDAAAEHSYLNPSSCAAEFDCSNAGLNYQFEVAARLGEVYSADQFERQLDAEAVVHHSSVHSAAEKNPIDPEPSKKQSSGVPAEAANDAFAAGSASGKRGGKQCLSGGCGAAGFKGLLASSSSASAGGHDAATATCKSWRRASANSSAFAATQGYTQQNEATASRGDSESQQGLAVGVSPVSFGGERNLQKQRQVEEKTLHQSSRGCGYRFTCKKVSAVEQGKSSAEVVASLLQGRKSRAVSCLKSCCSDFGSNDYWRSKGSPRFKHAGIGEQQRYRRLPLQQQQQSDFFEKQEKKERRPRSIREINILTPAKRQRPAVAAAKAGIDVALLQENSCSNTAAHGAADIKIRTTCTSVVEGEMRHADVSVSTDGRIAADDVETEKQQLPTDDRETAAAAARMHHGCLPPRKKKRGAVHVCNSDSKTAIQRGATAALRTPNGEEKIDQTAAIFKGASESVASAYLSISNFQSDVAPLQPMQGQHQEGQLQDCTSCFRNSASDVLPKCDRVRRGSGGGKRLCHSGNIFRRASSESVDHLKAATVSPRVQTQQRPLPEQLVSSSGFTKPLLAIPKGGVAATTPSGGRGSKRNPIVFTTTRQQQQRLSCPFVKVPHDEQQLQGEEEAMSEEEWARRASARMKDIAVGKATEGYRNFIRIIPREQRGEGDPRTPDPKQRCSKAQFHRELLDWRKQLHRFDGCCKPPATQVDKLRQFECSYSDVNLPAGSPLTKIYAAGGNKQAHNAGVLVSRLLPGEYNSTSSNADSLQHIQLRWGDSKDVCTTLASSEEFDPIAEFNKECERAGLHALGCFCVADKRAQEKANS